MLVLSWGVVFSCSSISVPVEPIGESICDGLSSFVVVG